MDLTRRKLYRGRDRVKGTHDMSKLKMKQNLVESGSWDAALKQSATRSRCHSSLPTLSTKPSLRG